MDVRTRIFIMNEKNFKLKVSNQFIKLSFNGSEDFVIKQTERFEEKITQLLDINTVEIKNQIHQNSSLKNAKQSTTYKENSDIDETQKYPNVLNFAENGEFDLITELPKGKKAENIIKLALIYLWAKKAINVSSASSTEIRNFCETENVKDSNFQPILNRNKNLILKKGKKSSPDKECSLTPRGIREAEKLLTELNEAGNS